MNSVGNLKLHRSKGQWLGVARALATALVLCCVAGPLHAAEEDAHVVMLYGVDPYLPPFLVMDKAVRETVAPKRCFQCCREAIMRRLRSLG
jgi:hypothetical protein